MPVLLLTEKDTVATALEEIKAGETADLILSGKKIGEIKALDDIPYGFKICAKPMSKGGEVLKYAHVIGRASQDIAVGTLVHVHNIEGNRGRGDLE